MERNALISVIVPVYKAEKYLDKCVRSILNQTYRNLEVILVDDGSPDRSGEICDVFAAEDSRVRVIHQENGGVSTARNAGLDAMSGQYFCFVDSDDYAEPEMVEKLYEAAINTNAELVACGIKISRYDKVEILTPAVRMIVGSEEIARYVATNCAKWIANAPWAKLYKSDSLGNKRFDKKMSLGEDAKFNIQYLDNIKTMAVIDNNLYCYVDCPESLTKVYRPSDFDGMRSLHCATLAYIKRATPRCCGIDLSQVNWRCFSYMCVFMAQYFWKTGTKERKAFIRKVCRDPIVQQAVLDLPEMTLVYKVYAWAVKHKYVWLLYVLSWIKAKRMKRLQRQSK